MKHIVFFLLFLISLSLAAKEQNTLQGETILNMFNSLLSPQNNQNSNNIPENDMKNGNELNKLENNFSKFNFKQIPQKKKTKKNVKSKKGRKFRIRRRQTFKDPIQVISEGWLKISSPMFKHPGKFPPILLPDGEELQIRANEKNFRINEAHDPIESTKDAPPSELYFWFRLSGKNLYYSQTKTDMNVLGNLAFANILNTKRVEGNSSEKNCFRLIDRANRKWKLCAETKDLKRKWVCQLMTMLGFTKVRDCQKAKRKINKRKKKSDPNSPNDPAKDDGTDGTNKRKPTVLTRKVTTPIILIPLPSKDCNESWDYGNKGADWECECKEGKEQSPINLPSKDQAIISPIKPIFTFNEVRPKSKKTTSSGQFKSTKILTIKHKDQALRINHKYFGKTVTLDGGLYTAEEIVFHTPSEHQIDGKTYDMEMQVIHYGKSKGDIAKQVILCFLFQSKAGVYNKFIDDLDFFNLPNANTKRKPLLNSLFIPKIFYNADQQGTPLLKPFSFYTYQGSLTQPPCTQRSIVYVAAKPIKLGTSAIQLFQEAIRVPDKITSTGDIITSELPNENNRNIQPLNGRAVFYYDHKKFCGDTKKIEKRTGFKIFGPGAAGKRRKRQIKGHYEKVLKKMNEYFYVNGPLPSGLPGAYVVSSKEAIGEGA